MGKLFHKDKDFFLLREGRGEMDIYLLNERKNNDDYLEIRHCDPSSNTQSPPP